MEELIKKYEKILTEIKKDKELAENNPKGELFVAIFLARIVTLEEVIEDLKLLKE